MSAESETWYPSPDELGIDEALRAKIAHELLNTEPLPASGRSGRETCGQWNQESLVAYGKWVMGIVTPQLGSQGVLTQKLIDRASHLNLGPSAMTIRSTEDVGTIHKLQQLLEQRPTFPFASWTKDEIVHRGRRIAKKRQDGRLTRADLNDLSNRGIFPGYKTITRRFGTLSHFHELTGYPSVRSWEEDDYLQWGAAFLDQNPGGFLGVAAVTELSKRRVGPSEPSISKYFGNVPAFREQVEADYEEQAQTGEEVRLAAQTALKQDLEDEVIPASFFAELDSQEILQVYCLLKVAGKLLPDLSFDQVKTACQIKDANVAVRAIANLNANISVADVEITAERLGLYDVIWPAKRFSGVNLRLSNKD